MVLGGVGGLWCSRRVMVYKRSTSWMTKTRVFTVIRLKETLPVMVHQPMGADLLQVFLRSKAAVSQVRTRNRLSGLVVVRAGLPRGESEAPEVVAPMA